MARPRPGLFAEQAGYESTSPPPPEYPGAVHAASALLDRATNSPTERSDLIDAALDQPVVMRWDPIADRVVHNELSEVVPQDRGHQQAARAHLINHMAVPEWRGVQDREKGGPRVERLTNEGLDRAVAEVREHYQKNPDRPFPAKVPNPAAAVAAETDQTEQRRAVAPSDRGSHADLSNLPPPDASTRISRDPQATGQQQSAPQQTGRHRHRGRPAPSRSRPTCRPSRTSCPRRGCAERAAQRSGSCGIGTPAGWGDAISQWAGACSSGHSSAAVSRGWIPRCFEFAGCLGGSHPPNP